MHIKARAPARIDLAGGTLDLWPLYLFFENTATINCAIDQFAEVELTTGSESKIGDVQSIELTSHDRGLTHTFKSYGELLESFEGGYKPTQLPSGLWLHAKVIRHFFAFWRRSAALKVETKCASPAGAGLGGSSTLNIALCNAMKKLTLANYTEDEIIQVARDLETTIIEAPAGVQDYWAAQYGSVQAIRMDAGRLHRKVFYKQSEFIENHIILCFSGQSRNSGINNWLVYKNFIDGDQNIRNAFKEIVKATYRVEEALEKQSLSKLTEGIAMEWKARQSLAPSIATPEMIQVIDAAKNQGALAAKVCGAGGGGCFILVVPPEKKDSISSYLKQQSIQVIDFKVVTEGCTLNVS